MADLPVYSSQKEHFIKEFYDPVKQEPRRGYLSDEVAFEIAAERWEKVQRHPLNFKYRTLLRAKHPAKSRK